MGQTPFLHEKQNQAFKTNHQEQARIEDWNDLTKDNFALIMVVVGGPPGL
jgi:hypothetical protein